MARSKKNPVTRKGGLSPNVLMTLVIAVVAVLVLGGVFVFGGSDGDGGAPDSAAVPAEVLRKPDSQLLTEAPGGKATLVEFLDYQCPACASYYSNITSKIETDYAGRITFVARNFPLEMHALAVPAAKAAEAASLQGRFKEMYHALYDNYQQWAIAPDGQQLTTDVAAANVHFEQYAAQLGLDPVKFRADLASPEVQRRIDQDTADGRQAGVNSTPTLYVNGVKFVPKGDTFAAVDQELRSMLDKALG